MPGEAAPDTLLEAVMQCVKAARMVEGLGHICTVVALL